MSTYPPPPEDPFGGPAPYGQPPAPEYGQQQPPYQEPQYQQPSYPQEQYPQQPAYGQPAYGQPQYGQVPPQAGQQPPQAGQYAAPEGAWNAYGTFVPAPPPRSRKGLKIGLSIGAVVILAVGGTIAYAVGNAVHKATAGMGTYKLVAPATFQGLTRQDDNSITKSARGSSDSMGKAGATPLVTSYVTSASAKLPQFVVIGGYGKLPLASLQLGQFWDGITGASSANTVTQKVNEDPGPLKGSMQCALVKEGTVYFPTCVWADNSTFAGIMDMAHITSDKPDLPALAAQVRALRAAMEVKK
jgi:hypothetical protein